MGRERKTERWWALMFDYGKEQVRKEWRDGEQRSRGRKMRFWDI